jgi:hypothetical protein
MQSVRKAVLMAVVAIICAVALSVFHTAPLSAASTPGFVYALVDRTGAANQLYGFSLDAFGALALLPGFPTPTGGNGNGNTVSEELVFDPVRGRLYSINGGSSTVSAFAVNRATGAVTTLPFSPIAVPSGPQCLAISPTGSVLIVGRSGSSLASFLIGDATATAAPSSPFSTGAASFSCAFSRDGAFAYTGGNSGSTMAGFSVANATGVLTAVAGSPFNLGFANPMGYQTDASGRLFGMAFSSNQIFAFTTASGVPTPVTSNNVASGQSGVDHGLLHPGGFFISTARSSNNVGVFRIAGTGAATTLTAVAGSPFAAGGSFSTSSVTDTAGTVVVTSNGTSRNLTTFAFNSTTGALTQTSVQPANTLGTTGRILGLAYAPMAIAASNPPAGPAAPAPPTITAIADQTIAVNGSATMSFTVSGSIIPAALRVSATSSDSTLVPPSALTVTHTNSGNDTLRVQGADGRSGTATITVTVSDGTQSASTSFALHVGVVSGTPDSPTTTPTSLVATASGSGAVLTWSPPTAGAPTRYVVVGGIASGGSELGVMMSADSSTAFTIPVLPPGTYYFRVYGVTPGSLSPASNESGVTVPGLAGAAAPPLFLGATVDGREVTLRWTPSPFGGASTIDIVEFGTAPGARDVAIVTAVTPVHTRRMDPGMLWARVRATNAAGVGGPSMDVQVPVAPAACIAAPDAPVLLPATIVGRTVGFAWFQPAGTAAATYRVDVSDVAGTVTPVSTIGPGASVVWTPPAAGTYSARVTALNACGSSAASAALVIGVQ